VEEAAKADRSKSVLPVTHGHGYDFLIWFSVATGLRLGEVRALRRGRCHLDDSVARLHGPSLPYVEVVESVTDVHGKGLDDDDAPLSVTGQSWGDPKSHRARVVYLPKSVAEGLQRHLDENVADDSDALVFTAPKGGTLTRTT
jgi:integrase